MRKKDYTPLTWRNYFSDARDIKTSATDTFRVYTKGTGGPLLLLLHGGGYSGLTWSLFVKEICFIVDCQIAAVDIRGHGETVTAQEDDLSAATLSKDIGAIYNAMYLDNSNQPPVILMGHSMGGAVAVHAASMGVIPNLLGLIVIDVVEGTALEALQSMQTFLRGRPASFASLEYAVEWCVRSGQVRNLESARVSMPSQLKHSETGEPATKFVTEAPSSPSAVEESSDPSTTDKLPSTKIGINQIVEEPEDSNPELSPAEECSTPFKQPATCATDDSAKFVWRIDLSKTEEYWKGECQNIKGACQPCLNRGDCY